MAEYDPAQHALGRGLVQTVSTYSGVQEEKISASININDHTVAVYDDEPGGNGTAGSVKEHYQITRTALAASARCLHHRCQRVITLRNLRIG